MTKPKRKALDDSLAQAFVYSDNPDQANAQATSSEATTTATEASPITGANLLTKLKMEVKEPTIRFTADLPQSTHRKLSILAARTGKKKVEIVRMLLTEALQDIED